MAIPVVLIVLMYFILGKKLKKNAFAWAFVGLGVLITVQLMGVPLLMITKNPTSSLFLWTMVHLASYVIAAGIAFLIALRNKLIRL